MKETLSVSRKVRSLAIMAVAAVMVLSLALMAGCSSNSSSSSSSSAATSSAASSAGKTAASADLMSGKHHAVIEVEGYDPINVELDADEAPITVTNFVDLVNDGYYDGKTFYRIVENFCLQGGTLGKNAAGNDPSLTPIDGEFSGNGYANDLADNFGYGTIAMARTSDPDSATSTFFITLGPNEYVGQSLDGSYAAFGQVDDAGMDIISQIVSDYVPYVDDPSMGTISSEASQAKIKSIKIVD